MKQGDRAFSLLLIAGLVAGCGEASSSASASTSPVANKASTDNDREIQRDVAQETPLDALGCVVEEED